MIRQPPRSTRTDTLLPYTTRSRSVKKALNERSVIFDSAPHLAWPMPFVIPRMRDARPEWQIRLALLLYDHLGDRGGMAKSRTIRLRQDRAGRGLDPGIFKGWRYWDGWIDDERRVIALLRDAEARGATLFPRIAATHAEDRKSTRLNSSH